MMISPRPNWYHLLWLELGTVLFLENPKIQQTTFRAGSLRGAPNRTQITNSKTKTLFQDIEVLYTTSFTATGIWLLHMHSRIAVRWRVRADAALLLLETITSAPRSPEPPDPKPALAAALACEAPSPSSTRPQEATAAAKTNRTASAAAQQAPRTRSVLPARPQGAAAAGGTSQATAPACTRGRGSAGPGRLAGPATSGRNRQEGEQRGRRVCAPD